MNTLKYIPRRPRRQALKLIRTERKFKRQVKKWIRKAITAIRIYNANKVMKKSGLGLSRLDFFHSFFYGTERRQISLKHSIWADASVTFVVKRRGSICGVVGGNLRGDTFSVRQLQGVKRAKFHDTDGNVYMLQCAEEIAKALGLKRISVRAYSYPKKLPEKQNKKDICHRKDRIYNQTPERLGYVYKRSTFRRFRRWESRFDKPSVYQLETITSS